MIKTLVSFYFQVIFNFLKIISACKSMTYFLSSFFHRYSITNDFHGNIRKHYFIHLEYCLLYNKAQQYTDNQRQTRNFSSNMYKKCSVYCTVVANSLPLYISTTRICTYTVYCIAKNVTNFHPYTNFYKNSRET